MTTPQPTHLIGFWPLWEELGVVAYDQTGNEQHGAYANVTIAQPGLGDGRTSAFFNGTSSNVQLPPVLLTANFNGAVGSIDGWLKVANAGVLTDATARRPISIRVSSNDSAHLRRTSANNTFAFEYIAGGVNRNVVFTSTSLEWQHVCMTWDKAADEVKAYVDGVLVGTTTGLGTWSGGTLGSCFIGAQTGGAGPTSVWSGWLTRWRVWDVALTADEVAEAAELPDTELRRRKLTGRTFLPTGEPWPEAAHLVQLADLGYIAQGTFPTAPVSFDSGSDGRWSTLLWTNADSLRPNRYRMFYPDGKDEFFILPSGDTPISIEEVRGLQRAVPYIVPGTEDLIDESREGIYGALANPNDVDLGDHLIGARPTGALGTTQTVHDVLFRTIDIADHGAVANGLTDIAPSVAECLSIALPGDTIHIRADAAGGAYRWASTVIWNKAVNLRISGTVSTGTLALIRVEVSNVTIDATGGTIYHTPATGAQSIGALWLRKDAAIGDVPGYYRNWKVLGGTWRNITIRMTKFGRQSVRVPLIYTLLAAPMEIGDTVLTVREVPDDMTTAMQARILLLSGVVEARQITALDPTARTITVASGFTDSAPTGRRVTGYTTTTAPLTPGQTVIPVSLGDTSNLFPAGLWAVLQLTAVRTHVAQIVSSTTNSVTLAAGVPTSLASGALFSGLNTGITNTGTDVEACTLRDMDLGHVRSNYAIEVGGGENALIEHCYLHDIVHWYDANSTRYFTEVPPSEVPPNLEDPYDAEFNVAFGEAFKITANTKNCIVRACVLRRFARNGFDAFNSGELLIDSCLIEDGYYAAALESKWSNSDVTLPVQVKMVNCIIRRMPTFGVIAGVPGCLVQGNTIEDIGLSGIYINGGHRASLLVPGDDDEEEGSDLGITTGVRLLANRLRTIGNTGIFVSEVDGAVIADNEITGWNGYAIQLNPAAVRITISRNRLVEPASGSTYIRIAGTLGTPSLHHLQDNETDTFATEVSADGVEIPTFYTVNGFGSEFDLASGAQPTAARWRTGSHVRNVTDQKIWIKTVNGMILLN